MLNADHLIILMSMLILLRRKKLVLFWQLKISGHDKDNDSWKLRREQILQWQIFSFRLCQLDLVSTGGMDVLMDQDRSTGMSSNCL